MCVLCWVPCVALLSGGGSSAGSSHLRGSPVGGVLPCPVPVSRGISSSSCLSLALTLSQLCLFMSHLSAVIARLAATPISMAVVPPRLLMSNATRSPFATERYLYPAKENIKMEMCVCFFLNMLLCILEFYFSIVCLSLLMSNATRSPFATERYL